MPKFRKKLIELDAVQWFKHGDHPKVTRRYDAVSSLWGFIQTLHGDMLVVPGDWIIGPGPAGEYWPVKEAVFPELYEPVIDLDDQGVPA